MKSISILLFFCLLYFSFDSFSQTTNQPPAKPVPALFSKEDYRESPEKKFDLIHTKLAVRFDYENHRMPGKVWLTLKPHIYPQQQLQLDAKGMFIHKVMLVKGTTTLPLHFDYSDSMHINISLDKTYTSNERITIFIDYTARPDEMEFEGSKAITDARGLYFINPDGKDTTKPIQIWTQGETEATSVWCPTIDKPNQKTTEEIEMTVPAKYVSISNGVLVKQVKHNDGTRTDYWKMDKPHAPYLFFMGVGNYVVIHDKYKSIPVDYYVEKKYAPVAKRIFGETPAMIAFYSKILGYEYPWQKYAQVVGRDYVSGAMENTTATLHGSAAYQNERQLKDENKWETTVAHELFHQWFGDLVTAESWSNITVNESMADYSEFLWVEHRYGLDYALSLNQDEMRQYMMNPDNFSKDLVRFEYDDKEEVFDGVSYQKGGRVLSMLRHYLGDSAFFKGLNIYLNQNKFGNAEAHQLRLAFESASGRDLNWFFNQWYFSNSHPRVDISYLFDDTAQTAAIIITQKQKSHLYNIPVEINVYTNGKPKMLTYWIKGPSDTIALAYELKPDWIDVDPSRLMLWDKRNLQSEDQWLAQAKFANNHLQKAEVMEYMGKNWKEKPAYRNFLDSMLNNKFYGNRKLALQWLKRGSIIPTAGELKMIESIATTDDNYPLRALAIDVLSLVNGSTYNNLFSRSITDSSYSVAGAALEAVVRKNPELAVERAAGLKNDAKGRLSTSLDLIEYLQKSTDSVSQVLTGYNNMELFDKLKQTNGLLYYANRLDSLQNFRKVAGAALETYKFVQTDFMGFQSTFASTLHWMIHERESLLASDPKNTVVQEQLKFLKEKSGL